MAKVTKEKIDETVDRILKTDHLLDIKRDLKREGYSGAQASRIVKEARDFIKAYTTEGDGLQRDLNIYRLNDIVLNSPNADEVISAIDKLNKMYGLYTTKVELNKDVRFVLGNEDDDWLEYDGETEETEAEKS